MSLITQELKITCILPNSFNMCRNSCFLNQTPAFCKDAFGTIFVGEVTCVTRLVRASGHVPHYRQSKRAIVLCVLCVVDRYRDCVVRVVTVLVIVGVTVTGSRSRDIYFSNVWSKHSIMTVSVSSKWSRSSLSP
jgi:hypothetical protein